MSTAAAWVFGTPETLDRSVPRPSAAESCAHVRARMAQDGLAVTEEELTLGEAIAWLRDRSRPVHEVFEVLSLMVSRARPTALNLAPGWRLARTRRGGPFILLQIGRA